MERNASLPAVAACVFALAFGLVLFELLLTRLFAVVLFAQFAHLALAIALLGISIGAVLQHLRPSLVPEQGLERRLAGLTLAFGLLALVAVVCTVGFPVTVQFDEPPLTYQERSHVKDELLDPLWFGALLPVLTLPFVAAGLAFAGVFQRRRKQIGLIYGADLAGGAAAAVVFVPVLGWLSGPDAVFAVILATAAGAGWLFQRVGARRATAAAGVLGLAGALTCGVGLRGAEILGVRYAAGYAEELVTWSTWTPLTRVSVHEDPRRGSYVLLDNSSASEVFEDEDRRAEVARSALNRSLVYRLHEPGARIAILAASAGPEVAVAQHYGHTGVHAIDIAGEIFEVVADRFPDSPVNPYLQGDTVRVKADGRAAILHAEAPYDVIHMVHANLWSSAGLLASAWSPSLLETVEAFETYLDQLSEDGTIAFGRGPATDAILRAAVEALGRRGVSEPWRHVFYLRADTSLLLVKKRPWTRAERDRAAALLEEYRRPVIEVDPFVEPDADARALLRGAVMTDDRPYLDRPKLVLRHLKSALSRLRGEREGPLAVVYRSIVIQAAFVSLAGLLFLLVPFLRRGPTQLRGLRGAGAGLSYVACLGYGYLAVETVLIHELVLFVGHPTYAVTVTILAMLASSGIGSVLAGRLAEERLLAALRVVLAGVLVLGAFQAFVVPELLHGLALGLPLGVRLALTLLVLAPLGLLMGMPFPLALRLLREEAGGIVPWAWALNGWTSVVASLVTVVISRASGYSVAFAVALGAYALALVLAGSLPRIGR